MAIYNINGSTIRSAYDVNGNVISGNCSSVGFVTDPEYITVDGAPYRLVWHDEFDGKDLDRDYWADRYFVDGVPDRSRAQSDYYLDDSKLHVRIKKDAPARYTSEESTTDVAVSGIQTGESNKYRTGNGHNHDINPFWGLIAQEGYWECRLKIWRATGGNHCGWWCMGIQDTDKLYRGEIDIAEILCHQSNKLPHGQHQITDTTITELYRTTDVNVDFASAFHTIGFLWKNGIYKWYVDGTLVDTMTLNTPQYPMIHILSGYKTRSGSSWTGDADTTLGDVEMQVDWLRIYKRASRQATENVSIDECAPIAVNGNTDDMTIDPDRGCPAAFPSFVYVNWSDGSRTEHWVKWQAVQETYEGKMTNHESFQWAGYVYGLGIEISANVNY